eukprot:Nitzschia sp. Nitz4//scaffold42_size132992//74045//75133//NITZ4_003400-RA/size132992-processed-gene-0.35-mRNA-1//-1//CDS//3329551721//5969//frame0
MATTPTTTVASSPGIPATADTATSGANAVNSAEDLRRQLRAEMQRLNRREPLDPTYQKLLMNRTLTTKTPVLPKDKAYKKITSRLRERVEKYMQEMQGKDPFDRISQRKPLDEDNMRSAFTLREAKDHEQAPLLEATLLSSAQYMDPVRKEHLEGIALGLQVRKEKKLRPTPAAAASHKAAADATEAARQRAELEKQRAQARQREEARKKREEEDRRRRDEEMAASRKRAESPQQALQKIIEPVFKKLWDMEFPNLGGTNPFRTVIDRENCTAMGAPDYFEIITTPMNLTYMQTKVNKGQYSTIQSFFADVDLIISNAIKYNSDPGNPFRIAAEEMKKMHDKIVKRVWQQIQQRQQAQKANT